MATTTKLKNGGSITIMSKTPKAQPSTINGVATKESIAIANAKNARAEALEAKNRASGVKYADDVGYAPSTGTYTTNRNSPSGGSTTYKNGVLQGTYDSAGNFTKATSEQIAKQKVQNGVSSSSDGGEAEFMARNGFTPTYDKNGKLVSISKNGRNLTPNTLTETVDTREKNPVINTNTNEVSGGYALPEGYEIENGVLTVDGVEATPEQSLLASQYALAGEVAMSEYDIAVRDGLNVLKDMERIMGRTTDYLKNTEENAIQTMEDEKAIALEELNLAKEELQFNLQNALGDLEGQRVNTQSDYLNASIRAGGARFSTMATGQMNINKEFAELQQRTYQKASNDMAKLGIQESAIRNYYASKITDIRLNSQEQIGQMADKMMTTTRDIILGMGDNKLKMTQTLNKYKLDFQGKVMEMNAKAIEAEQDAIKENLDLILKGQQMATNSGKSFSMVMPNGEVMTWTPKPKSTGSGSSTKIDKEFGSLSDKQYLEMVENKLITQDDLRKYRPHLATKQLEDIKLQSRKNAIKRAEQVASGEIKEEDIDFSGVDEVAMQIYKNTLNSIRRKNDTFDNPFN